MLNKDGVKTLVTPGLEKGTILPGVTRDSVIRVAKEVLGLKVEERDLKIEGEAKAGTIYIYIY